MGHCHDAICTICGTRFTVSEGSGMIAMPFHCTRCGREWWWEFGSGGPMDKEADPSLCECGGRFAPEAPPRCPNCAGLELEPDPRGQSMIYD